MTLPGCMTPGHVQGATLGALRGTQEGAAATKAAEWVEKNPSVGAAPGYAPRDPIIHTPYGDFRESVLEEARRQQELREQTRSNR